MAAICFVWEGLYPIWIKLQLFHSKIRNSLGRQEVVANLGHLVEVPFFPRNLIVFVTNGTIREAWP